MAADTTAELSAYDEALIAKCRKAREIYSLDGVGPVTSAQRQLVHDLCDGINHLLNLNAGHREMIASLRAEKSA
jgi:hypothetical protein